MLKDFINQLLKILNDIKWPLHGNFPTLEFLNFFNDNTEIYNEKIALTWREAAKAKGYEISIKKLFQETLEQDEHIFKCCGDIYNLAALIDTYLLSNYGKNDFDRQYSMFEHIVYKTGEYSKIAFSHIFNLDLKVDTLSFRNFEIVKIDDKDIPDITGENPYLPSFLHPPGVGNFFIKFKDNDAINHKDIGNWLLTCHNHALDIIRVFQYMRDKIIHLDYTTLYFTPKWVNTIRRPGIFMIGRPRTSFFEGSEKYCLDSNEGETFNKVLEIFYNYRSKIYDDNSALRRVIRNASNYYELSLRAERLDEKFIDLWISMEALFSPSDKDQLRHSIAENAAFILKDTPDDRREIFQKLQKLYDKRSHIVHGSIRGELDLGEVELLSSLVRLSILKFTVLQLRGISSVIEIHKRIRAAIFDPEESEKLHNDSEIEGFLMEKEGMEISF